LRADIFAAASHPDLLASGTEIIHTDLPSRHFEPRIYGVGAWTHQLHFAYGLVTAMRPRVLVELGVDRGENYFALPAGGGKQNGHLRFWDPGSVRTILPESKCT
jgi:hypothetical protein